MTATPASRKIFVQLSESDAVRLKVKCRPVVGPYRW